MTTHPIRFGLNCAITLGLGGYFAGFHTGKARARREAIHQTRSATTQADDDLRQVKSEADRLQKQTSMRADYRANLGLQNRSQLEMDELLSTWDMQHERPPEQPIKE